MTNLTEKWKKGELPDGYYYVKDGENMIAEYLDGYFYNKGLPMTSFSGGVDEVLAEVPSYEEWKSAQEQLQKDGVWYTEISHKKVLKEYKQLKNLLKGAREVLKMVDTYCGDYDSINGFLIVEEINQVLGEE